MTEQAKAQINSLIKMAFTALLGGLLTLLLTNIHQTSQNTSDIAVLKSVVEPLRDSPAKLSELNTKADRNYALLEELMKMHLDGGSKEIKK